MDARSSNSFADSQLHLLLRAILAGMGELALLRHWRAGLVIAACFVPFSARASALALAGAAASTGWAFWRQRDVRLLTSGWYGVNGALCGFLVEWHFAHPAGAVLLTLFVAVMAAIILDTIVFALGDAPVGLPPLTIPFLVVAALMTLAIKPLQAGLERVEAVLAAATASPTPSSSWVPAAGDPEAETAWRAYGAGDYRLARAEFLRLAQKSPEKAEIWNGLGWSEWRLRDGQAAIRAFNRALSLDGAHPYALDGLGWIALEAGRLREAEGHFRSARISAPTWADPSVGLGWAVYGSGRYGEAEALFRQSLELAPQSAPAMGGLGWTSLRSGDYRTAQAMFERALAADGDSALAGEGLGRSLLALGERQRAENRFLALLGKSPQAIQGLADVRRMMLLHGETALIDSLEWAGVAERIGWAGGGMVLLVGAVLLWSPASGLIALSLAGLGLALSVALAGPCSVLWIDLHLQTVAMLGLLMGRPRHRPSPAGFLATLLSGIGLWAGLHLLGAWLPLLSFNMAAVLGLTLFRQDETRWLP
ncbi:MAG: urea transporter [Magnetospirillum sp.]|nr:urea transporter [Magnetospirillum sp.]